MAVLEIEGVGKVEVADDFLKKSATDQQKEIDYIAEQGRVKSVSADIQRSAGQPDYSKMSAGELAKTAVSNVPRSAVEFGKSVVQPVLHPIETAENLGRIGKGVLQKLGVISDKDATQYADAVGKMLVDRYGSKDAILKTLATDPVGIMADVSTVLSAGGSLAVRAPGLVSRVGEAAQVAGRMTNPLSAVAPVAKASGKLASEALGITTGAGGEAIRTAAQAGAEGGEAGKAFLQNMRGQEPVEQVVADARAAVGNLRQQRGDIYRQEMAKIGGDQTVLDFGDIDKAVDNTVKEYKGQSLSPSTAKIQSDIRDAVEAWKQLPAQDFHTAEGLDALKQKIGDVRDNTQYGSPQRAAADTVYNAIKNTIVKQNPEYAKVMKGYQEASDQIKEIERTLSTNPKASIDTALRKITSALRDNVNTNYGKRKELVGFLARSGAKHLLQKIAGQALKGVAPRGLATLGPIGEVPAAIGALLLGHPAAAAGIAASALGSSPRLVGEAAFKAGQASRLPFRQAGLGARLLNGGNQ